MFHFLPSLILYPINVLGQMLNLAFWGTFVLFFGLLKLAVPHQGYRKFMTRVTNFGMGGFGVGSLWLLSLTNNIDWDVKVDGELKPDGWYLMMSNHLSWLDIMILAKFCAGRIPATKFFIKQELIWMPFVGLAAWALDMPFMKRYSSEFLAKNPHLRGKDIETTRKACEKFKQTPTTIVNFVEGTRYDPKKLARRPSTFENLMPPKAGGVAFTLATMGKLFTKVLDVTIAFPKNPGKVMHQALQGRLETIVVHVKVLPVEPTMIGNYFEDENFKQEFQLWLNNSWEQKDLLLKTIKQG